MQKAEKVSNNCGLKTIGSPVDLVVITDTEIIMLDSSDRSNVIRQYSIDLYEKCVMHPDENLGCFAFSTSIPGNQQKSQHKIHLFTMAVHLKDEIMKSFAEHEQNKNRSASLSRGDHLI